MTQLRTSVIWTTAAAVTALASVVWGRAQQSNAEISAAAVSEIQMLSTDYSARAAEEADAAADALTTGWNGGPSIARRVKALAGVMGRLEGDHDSVAARFDKIKDRALARLARGDADQTLIDAVVLAHSTGRGTASFARSEALSAVFSAVGDDNALIQ